ncbi:Cyclophilin-like domain containing protein [Elaphomyces granulatus]
MSSHYNTEPPPTASVTLVTTVGPLHISLFAKQTPLACKNFVQHCLDGYYVGSSFHRVVRGFIMQGGDPSGSGFGGSSIYEDPEFEYDPEGRDPNEKVVFTDELHSRLRFNRRGMVGMAKSEDGTYGSQFFITLANVERELNSKCTLFGRIEGDGIYNVVKIAEAELIEGTDRPIYPVRITGCEIGEIGPFQGKLKKRDKIAVSGTKASEESAIAIKKKKKTKGGKTLLSFGTDDIVEGGLAVKSSKPKFNTRLVSVGDTLDQEPKKQQETRSEQRTRKRQRSPSPSQTSQNHNHRPKTPDPYAQLPLPDPEAPHRSPSPSPSPPLKASALDRTNAEIASLKASMRRNIVPVATDISKKRSALEAMIPETAICGRKRPLGGNITTGGAEAETLKLLNAFKAKLEGAEAGGDKTEKASSRSSGRVRVNNGDSRDAEEEDEEAQLCDLHFIANCQSCKPWDNPDSETLDGTYEDISSSDWMTHELRFGKDMLGKDLGWKREHEDADSLVVIDPREREKEIIGNKRNQRARERDRKLDRTDDREWDRMPMRK